MRSTLIETGFDFTLRRLGKRSISVYGVLSNVTGGNDSVDAGRVVDSHYRFFFSFVAAARSEGIDLPLMNFF